MSSSPINSATASRCTSSPICRVGLVLLTCWLGISSHAYAQYTDTILYNFNGPPNDGRSPNSTLIQTADGSFYGTTQFGGTNGGANQTSGIIFKMTPAGSLTVLHNFSGPPDGGTPGGSLVQGSDGLFYGTTESGGVGSLPFGTVFKMTASGTLTVLHSFFDGTVPSDGDEPTGALVAGADGNFYGTTFSGGVTGEGTIYNISPTTGAVTILHSFSDTTGDGAQPLAGLILASDGNFYGTTSKGGANNFGTIFRMTMTGGTAAVTILHSFSNATTDGDDPEARLTQGTDGNLYGTTSVGGTAGQGTVFEMTTSGTVTILHSFAGGPSDGTAPRAELIQGTDGNLYGTTSGGGSADKGTVFKITPIGTLTVLHNFNDGSVANDGVLPIAGLIQGLDGNLYGAAAEGGSASDGAIFKLSPSSVAPMSF
ncbi:MAG TPA: choice-of-anchor tandem repeat GloVer-containing protein, partial [Candidatus Methylacidiphilales bacterium]